MLEIQLGLNRDKRRARTLNNIREAQAAGAPHVYVLTPEQSTFVLTRDVTNYLDNRCAGVEVFGFKQMFERIYSACGGRNTYLDDGGRLLAMSAAASRASRAGQLSALSANALRPEFLDQLLHTYSLLRQNGLQVSDVQGHLNSLANAAPATAGKAKDLVAIYSTYEELCSNGALDPNDEFGAVLQILDRSDWAKDSIWFIEGFSDFSAQQMPIIKWIIRNAVRVTVDMPILGLDDDKPSHRMAVKTAVQLSDYALQCNAGCEVIHVSAPISDAPALRYLQEHLCDDSPAAPADVPGGERRIKLFCDSSPYQECVHIAGTILRAQHNGYRFRDMSVVLCDYDRYAPIMETVCHRYGIPAYFSSRKDEMARKPILQAIFSALDAVTHGMQTEDVLQFFKSGLSPLSWDQADLIENYARTWRIYGRGWAPGDDGWTMHPDGYGQQLDDGSQQKLRAINEAREAGVGVLLTLKAALEAGTTVKDYLMALYTFLEDIHFTDRLQTVIDEFTASDEDQLAMEYTQVSEVLNHAMEQMYSAIGEEERSASDFAKLFRLLCCAYKIDTIPVGVDQVDVFDLQDARFTCSKLRYIAGAEEGNFPSYTATSGTILSEADVEAFVACGMEIPGTTEDQITRSLSAIDGVISGVKKMVVFSYSCNEESQTTPSHLVQRVLAMFPGVTAEKDAAETGIPAADLIAPEMAGRLLGRLWHRPECANVLAALASSENKTVQTTGMRIVDKADWALKDLSSQSIRGLYGELISLSATSVDTYSSCRYHYFLHYGLGLRPPAQGRFNSPAFGRFAHEVLERTIREVEDCHGGLGKVDRDTLRTIAQKHIDLYTAEKMKGLVSQPERYRYLYQRNCREVLSVLYNMASEFRVSQFRCVDFEMKVGGKDADMPAIPIPGKGLNGEFVGIIDRIDTCTVDGQLYYKVVDYKTGATKTMDYGDILCGLSLQVLLYQAELRKAGYGNDKGGSESAGALYVPAKEAIVATQTKVDDDKLNAERSKMLQRHGLLLNNPSVLLAMETPDEKGKTRYIPVRYRADGTPEGDLCSEEQLHCLDRFVEDKLSDIVTEVGSGVIAANPISRGVDRTACTYCPMRAACHKDTCGTKYRYRAQVDQAAFWSVVAGETSK